MMVTLMKSIVIELFPKHPTRSEFKTALKQLKSPLTYEGLVADQTDMGKKFAILSLYSCVVRYHLYSADNDGLNENRPDLDLAYRCL